MNNQSLQSCIDAIKQNPVDKDAWLSLGRVSKEYGDLKTAYQAYVTTISLGTTSDALKLEDWKEVQKSYTDILSKKGGVQVESFRLPAKKGFILIVGEINMDVTVWDRDATGFINSGVKHLLMDFSGVTIFSGLGPSTVKKILHLAKDKGANVYFLSLPDSLKSILDLKRISYQHYPTPFEAFKACVNV